MGVRVLAVFLAAAVLAVGCGGAGSGDVVVGGVEPAPLGAGPQDGPDVPAGLANCEDVPELRSRLEGTLGATRNADPIVKGVLATYAMEHPDTHAGRWTDRDSGGVLMIAFTDDPEPHRAAILARRPSPDDYPAVDPRPPITDHRPLGERDDVVIDVVQARFSELEVEAMRDEIWESISREDWNGFGLDGTGYDIKRQRVTLYLVNPPVGALAEIAERVPDQSALCVDVTRTPQPPAGPLDVIPDLAVEDPLVSCAGTPVVRYSQLIDPPSIDEVHHPAVDALRAELDADVDEHLPRGRWVVISINDHSATFAALWGDSFGVAGVERRGDRWIFSGHASGLPCEPVIPLPPGLARVEVQLDIDSMPGPADTTIDVLVTEQGCASSRVMGDALRGPQVIETGEAVLVAFAVVPVAGMATCPDNPSAAVSVELSRPLGERWVYDGLHFPPKPLTATGDPAMSVEWRDSFPCLAGSSFASDDTPEVPGIDSAGRSNAGGFETANGALLAQLGDLSEPLYDIKVAERGHGYDKWRIAIEDSDGTIHLGTVQARRVGGGLWQIEHARWCLTSDSNSATVKQNVAREHEELQAPAAFSECPMTSAAEHEVPEPPDEGFPTPGAALRASLSPLPTAPYTIRASTSTDDAVRWDITMPRGQWGLTYGRKAAVEDNGWRLRTDEWCHMELDRLLDSHQEGWTPPRTHDQDGVP
ncbi:MAG: hypothetical protein OXG30_09915 [bacterium]|nr:hypothetical protein [bacterium]